MVGVSNRSSEKVILGFFVTKDESAMADIRLFRENS